MLSNRQELPRPEYPRPQFARSLWFNLNGEWEFAFDDADAGLNEGWHDGRELPIAHYRSFCLSNFTLRHKR